MLGSASETPASFSRPEILPEALLRLIFASNSNVLARMDVKHLRIEIHEPIGLRLQRQDATEDLQEASGREFFLQSSVGKQKDLLVKA